MLRFRPAVALACAVLTSGLPAAAQPPAKTPIRGLVSMGAYKFVVNASDPVNSLEPLNAKPGIFGGIVILASWREMQLSATSGLTENNNVDRALQDVRAYNRRNPQKPLAVKLRIWGGFVAPDWAKQIGGPIINVTHKKPRTIGHFWSPPYRKAWARFQELLAARYDDEPLIHEVALTSCMSFTAEPFFLPNEPTVADPLTAAGFKPFEYKQCLLNAVSDYAPWKRTNVEIPLNPVRLPLNNPTADVAFTQQFMRACRQSIGKRCIFDNHDLSTDPGAGVQSIYDTMKKLGGPIELQTFEETPKDFDGTIKYAVSLGAGSVELWQDFGGFPLVPDPQLKRWAAMLEGNSGR